MNFVSCYKGCLLWFLLTMSRTSSVYFLYGIGSHTSAFIRMLWEASNPDRCASPSVSQRAVLEWIVRTGISHQFATSRWSCCLEDLAMSNPALWPKVGRDWWAIPGRLETWPSEKFLVLGKDTTGLFRAIGDGVAPVVCVPVTQIVFNLLGLTPIWTWKEEQGSWNDWRPLETGAFFNWRLIINSLYPFYVF